MKRSPSHAVDAWLWKKGLRVAEARNVLRRLVLAAGFAVPAGLLLWPLWNGFFWFGICVALGAWNFYNLTIFVQHAIREGWSGSLLTRLLLGSNGRLLLTGFFIYIAASQCAAPLTALAGGVSMPVALIFIEGLTRIFRSRRTSS